MTILLIVLGVMTAWCLVTLPLAVAVGRAFQAGEDRVCDGIAPDYDAAGV